ncbi:hypothetical protein QAD02_010140 [Eretmocerus hayati]|uniref:Uncharacterized protein n=1 Tax=Eretmocerus hayati TaxID=131215 RepID=A0ACC2NBD0_9HYME|nr:hypothetical protein QAD02_010140 [Eretmocerus hayati]
MSPKQLLTNMFRIPNDLKSCELGSGGLGFCQLREDCKNYSHNAQYDRTRSDEDVYDKRVCSGAHEICCPREEGSNITSASDTSDAIIKEPAKTLYKTTSDLRKMDGTSSRSTRATEANPDSIDPETLLPLTCGLNSIEYVGFVVGGFKTDPFAYPWMAALEYQTHPKARLTNDIALLKLGQTVKFTKEIKPICLPIKPDLPEYMTVIGWGRTELGVQSQVLLEADIPLADKQKCESIYQVYGFGKLGPTQICAGGKPDIDSCSGDSGGPLMADIKEKLDVREKSRTAVVGVVSFGSKSCGVRGFPGIYTKVYDYIPWILDKIRASSDASPQGMSRPPAGMPGPPPGMPGPPPGMPTTPEMPSE